MDEREAREWILKRRGGLGISGIDPPDWGRDLADSLASDVLAKATYQRGKRWTLIPLYTVGVVLFGVTVALCYRWLINGASGVPALISVIVLAVICVVYAKAQEHFDRHDSDYS